MPTFLDYHGKPLAEGQRVELHPATDLWMKGARFGVVTKLWVKPSDKSPVATIKLDKVRALKVFRVADIGGF